MISDSTKEKLIKKAPFSVVVLLVVLLGCRSSIPSSIIETPIHEQTLQAIVTDGKDPGTMVLIPAGHFLMGSEEGSEDEQPPHMVYLDAFYIDEAEVSCARYERFLQETGYPPHQLWNPDYQSAVTVQRESNLLVACTNTWWFASIFVPAMKRFARRAQHATPLRNKTCVWSFTVLAQTAPQLVHIMSDTFHGAI